MRAACVFLLLAACGGKAQSDDREPSEPSGPPAPDEVGCDLPARDFELIVVMLEANCTGEITVSPEVTCEFDDTATCNPQAFWCTFPDGSRAHHESGPGEWTVQHDYDSLLCDVTYDVGFPKIRRWP
jgi:hypothetical protein